MHLGPGGRAGLPRDAFLPRYQRHGRTATSGSFLPPCRSRPSRRRLRERADLLRRRRRTCIGSPRARSPGPSRLRWPPRRAPGRRSSDTRSGATCSAKPTRRRAEGGRARSPAGLVRSSASARRSPSGRQATTLAGRAAPAGGRRSSGLDGAALAQVIDRLRARVGDRHGAERDAAGRGGRAPGDPRVAHGTAARRRTRVLYGGSVNLKNIAELLAERELDGVLVGGASLDPGGLVAACVGRRVLAITPPRHVHRSPHPPPARSPS